MVVVPDRPGHGTNALQAFPHSRVTAGYSWPHLPEKSTKRFFAAASDATVETERRSGDIAS